MDAGAGITYDHGTGNAHPSTDRHMKPPGPDPGLCLACTHGRAVRSGKGSVFWQCTRGLSDATFPKYPRLPVDTCTGFESRHPEGGNGPDVDPH